VRSLSYIFGKGTGGGLANFDMPGDDRRLTLSEALQIQASKKHKSRSFWDRVKGAGSGALHPVEWTFDQILRPLHGVAEAERRIGAREHQITGDRKGRSWWSRELDLLKDAPHELRIGGQGFVAGVTNKKRTGFGEALEARHALIGHRRLRGVAGLGLDIAADPLTYLTGGTTIAARSAEHAFAVAAGRRAISDAPFNQVDKGVHIDEAINKTTEDIAHLGKLGKDYRYRKALAKINLKQLNAEKAGEALSDAFKSRKRIIAKGASAEEKRVESFVPHYKLAGVKITPDIVGRKAAETIGSKAFKEGRQLVPSLPKLDNFIAKNGVGSAAARRFREAIIRPASETPETHAMNITAKHLSERIMGQQHHTAMNIMAGSAKGIDGARQREILHHFEQPPKGMKAVIKQGDKFIVNPRYTERLISSGKITAKEAEFASNYQKVVENMYHNEKAFGSTVRHFSDTARGRMYVPHLMDREGVALHDEMRKMTTKAGFERGRSDRHFSLKQLVDMADEGSLPKSVVKDPYQLLVARTRASSRRQAELAQLKSLTEIGGIRTRTVDTKKLDAVREKLDMGTLNFLHRAEEHSAVAAKAIQEHEAAVAEAEKAVRRIRAGRVHKMKAANLGRAQKKLDTLKKKGPFLADAQERYDELDKLGKELSDLSDQEKTILKGKENRAGLKGEGELFTSPDLTDEFGHKIALPGELGQAAMKVRRIVDGDDAAIKGFEAGYRKMLAKWKILVTSINPSYRLRNSQTDLWNWWLVPGANSYVMGKNMAKATKMLKDLKNIDKKIAKYPEGEVPAHLIKAVNMYRDMYDNGVLSGLFQGDIETAAEMLRIGQSKKALLKRVKGISLAEKIAQDVNRNGENFVRMAHFIWAREDKHLSAVEAGDSVKAAHFDYEDLTPFEQRRLKAVAPFYTWSRKNIPYQIKAIFKTPGKYGAFPKAAMEADYVANDSQHDIIPSYISDAWGIPVGGHNYVLPQLGVSDLQTVDSPKGPLDRAESLLTPAAKLPLELAFNKNLFTGGPIASDTHSRNPTTSFGAALLHLLPGGNPGQTSRVGPGGGRVYGPGGNPYWLHALSYLGPTSNLLLKKSGGIGRAQMGPVSPMWSYGAGVSVQHVDQAQQQLLAQIVSSNEGKKMMQDMRDEGLIPQAKPPRGRKRHHLNALINANYGR
jgi:hypothetical protein